MGQGNRSLVLGCKERGFQVFECWRIQNGIRNQEITPLEILSFIGKRGMGALEFIPESSGIRKSEKLNMKLLTDLAQRIFLERENVRLLPDESLTMQSLIAVGTSAGGRHRDQSENRRNQKWSDSRSQGL